MGHPLFQSVKLSRDDCEFKFSYSELRDITICPHRYKLIAIDKLPQDFELRRLLVPNVIDLALTDWINNHFEGSLEQLAADRYNQYVIDNNKSLKWKHPLDLRDQYEHTRKTAIKLELSMRERDLCLPDAKAQGKLAVAIALSDGRRVKLTGRTDLVYTDRLWCYDLKTTENKRWLDEDQLIYYDFCMSLLLGKKLQKAGFLAPLINPPVQEMIVTRDHWSTLFGKVNQAIDYLVRQDFPLLGDEKQDCYLCFAKRYCDRYKPRSVDTIKIGDITKARF